MRALPAALILLTTTSLARAQSAPVVVPPDDERTHARLARAVFDASLWIARLHDGTGGDGDATWIWAQLGLGPLHHRIPLRGAELKPLDQWSARLRLGLIVQDGETATGPLTIAAMRHAPFSIFDVARMLHVETGLEIALSTPWLHADDVRPGPATRVLHGPDAEAADIGWGVRPASLRARVDVLACRSLHLEVGAGPELFDSTVDEERGADLGLRWHATLGVGLACGGSARTAFLNRITIAAQHRARAVLYNRDAPPSYAGTTSLMLAYGGRHVGLSAYVANGDWEAFWMVGFRASYTAGGR